MRTFKIVLALIVFINFSFAQTSATYIKVSGSGSPILFLPGFTNPGSIWNDTVQNLDQNAEYHLVSYAGFNGNQPIAMPWYPTIKNELINYIQQNNLQNLKIVGHSMGGNLAVDIAAALPDHITAMVLVDAIPCMRELMMPGVSVDQIQYDSPYNKQVLEMNKEQFEQSVAFMAQNMTNKKEKVQVLLNWMLQADRETYVLGYTDLLKLDLRPQLKNIKARTLILGAGFPSLEIAKENFEKQYANLSQKTIEMIPDSKHFIMFDQPELFYEKINAFFRNEQ